MKTRHDAAIAAVLVLLVVVLYRKVVRLWWTYDDAYLIHIAVDSTLADAFFNASIWPQKLFTPMVMTAFEGDLAAFGLDPSRWFVVHLVFVALSAIAFYGALRLWFAPWSAGAGAVLYVACVPLCSLTTEISGIHYFMAMITGSLATIAFVLALRRNRYSLALLSALILLIGMLAKETVIPLPFLFLALPERDLRTRARFAIPHAFALLIYFLWRRAVIGTFLGGYGWAVERGDWPLLFAALPKKIILASAGVNVALGVALIAIMAIGVVFAIRRNAILFVVALALATGPILPVSKEMQRRYALVPWLCWSIAFVAGIDVLRRKHPRAGAALLAAVPLFAIVVNRQEWGHEFGRTQRMSDEARFFFDMPPDSLLRAPIVPPGAMGEVNWLKTAHLRKPCCAAWFYDDYFLCTTNVEGKRAWQYEPAKRAIVGVDLAPIARKHCASIRQNAPLSASFDYRDGSLFWTFGPYEEGRYRLLLANGVQAFDVPREDGFQMQDVKQIALRIRYDSPQGWTTYSPELALDLDRRPRMTWKR